MLVISRGFEFTRITGLADGLTAQTHFGNGFLPSSRCHFGVGMGYEGFAELKIQGGRLLSLIHRVQEPFRLPPVRRAEALLFTGLIVLTVINARAFSAIHTICGFHGLTHINQHTGFFRVRVSEQ